MLDNIDDSHQNRPAAPLADAQQRLFDLTARLSLDPALAHSLAFIDAACVLWEQDRQQYHRLHRRLKDKYVRVTQWEREVKRPVRGRCRFRGYQTETGMLTSHRAVRVLGPL